MNAPPPPGWYPDQADQRYVRWWDGRQWTQHAQPAQPPQPVQPGYPPQQQPVQPKSPQSGRTPPGSPQPGPPQQPGHPNQAQPAPGHPTQVPPGHGPPAQAHPGQAYAPEGHPAQAAGRGDASEIELAMGGTGDAASIQKQAQRRTGAGGQVAGGGGTLFTEPVLVINQQAKLIEMANEYAVYNQHGAQIGSVVQTNQSGAQKALRLLTRLDTMMTVQLEIRDMAGMPQLRLTRPAALFKSTVNVHRPDGSPVGDIRMENLWGKLRFAYEVNGQRIGAMHAENLRAWDLRLLDHQDAEVGRISKTWEGLGKAAFTTADNYVLQIYRPLPDPLLSMVISSALTLDTALNQH